MAITSGDKKEDRGDDGINEQLCSQRNSWLNGIVLREKLVTVNLLRGMACK